MKPFRGMTFIPGFEKTGSVDAVLFIDVYKDLKLSRPLM
jgi:hypothetical protein